MRRRPFDGERAHDLQERIELRDGLLIREEALRHVHRCVADSLAWRAIGYERAVFAVLGEGERVGRFPDRTGLEAEHERAQHIWDHGSLPLLNDMTNTLRTGDLTVLHSRWPRPVVIADEVKRSGRPRRGRQTRMREARQRLLDDGWLPAAGDRPERAIWYSDAPYAHHLDLLRELIVDARADGFAARRTDAGMVVAVADLRKVSEHDDDPWTARAPAALGWTRGRISQGSALATRISERRRAGPSSLAPIAAFPLPAEDILDLLLGTLDYVVTINYDELATVFAERSIDVEFPDDPKLFLRATRAGSSVELGAVLRDQMLRETMTTATLVALVTSLLDGFDAGAPDIAWTVVMDERGSWPA